MGRRSTGVWTVDDGTLLNISALIKSGLFQPGQTKYTMWGWTTSAGKKNSVLIGVCYSDSEQYVHLKYDIKRNGEKTDMDYKIGFLERPSNLGIGKVLFFKCPVLLKPCRKLYLAYDSPIFKCREAYRNRIYYPIQLSGKLGRYNDLYWQFEHQIKDLEKGRSAYLYDGKVTRRAARLQRLYDKQEMVDWLRWQPETFPHCLRKSMLETLAEIENAHGKR